MHGNVHEAARYAGKFLGCEVNLRRREFQLHPHDRPESGGIGGRSGPTLERGHNGDGGNVVVMHFKMEQKCEGK